MATEGGADLREILRNVAMEWSEPEYDYRTAATLAQNRVDAILGAIAEAGWRLVPPVEGSSCCVNGECWSHDGHEWAGWFDEALLPGELEFGDGETIAKGSAGE